MDSTLNGGDPRTYKSKMKIDCACIFLIFLFKIIFLEVQDDDNTANNYQNSLNLNVSPLNDAATPNTDTQQTNSSTSSSTTNEPEPINSSSNDHGTSS
jgi:hypothetical protein